MLELNYLFECEARWTIKIILKSEDINWLLKKKKFKNFKNIFADEKWSYMDH